MREFNLLGTYPNPRKPRLVGKNIRTIKHRIVASKRDKNFLMGNVIMDMVDINTMVDGLKLQRI